MKGVLFTRRSPPEWGAYCTPILRLINESQLGAVANGGRARFSFAHNDLLVSSSTGYSQSARSDTSTPGSTILSGLSSN
jgi:hypothetical protein